MKKLLVTAVFNIDEICFSVEVEDYIYNKIVEIESNHEKIEDNIIYDDLCAIALDTLNNELPNIYFEDYKEFVRTHKTKSKKKFTNDFWLSHHVEFIFEALFNLK